MSYVNSLQILHAFLQISHVVNIFVHWKFARGRKHSYDHQIAKIETKGSNLGKQYAYSIQDSID